jgi:hypothetical protein
VTVTEREAGNDGLDWKPGEYAELAEKIRVDLPNAPKPPSKNLIAARHANTLKQEAAFLADTSGKVPPPEREDLIDALQFAANRLFDSVLIA